MRVLLSLFFLKLFLFTTISGYDTPKTFGGSISVGLLDPGKPEYEIFKREGSGILTFFWMTVGNPYAWEDEMKDIIIKYYLDDEVLEFRLDLMHGIGFGDTSAPWEGGPMVGKGATTGGVYNTYRIPFNKKVRVTMQGPQSQTKRWIIYTIIRGQEGLTDFRIGDLLVPSNARIHLHKLENYFVDSLGYVPLLQYHGGPGALMMVTLQVASYTMNFLEGCVRSTIDGEGPRLWASGTEDYFVSAFYFDAGPFHHATAGVTHLDRTDGAVRFSAYKFHTDDSIFWQKSINMTWRNGDTQDTATHLKCPMEGGHIVWNPTNSTITLYSLYYTWDNVSNPLDSAVLISISVASSVVGTGLIMFALYFFCLRKPKVDDYQQIKDR